MNPFETSVQRFDEFAAEYAQRFMNIDSYLPSIGKFCELITTQQPKILELACGPGNVTGYVKNRFPKSHYIAIDLAPRMIEIARKQVADVDFKVMDVRNISIFKTTFDAIMCSFCLPFLSGEDTHKLISDCAARLNENGVIYLSTMEGEESRAGFETTSFSGNSKVYFNYHRLQDLEDALTGSGVVIKQAKRQDYIEPDGSITTDLVIIGVKQK